MLRPALCLVFAALVFTAPIQGQDPSTFAPPLPEPQHFRMPPPDGPPGMPGHRGPRLSAEDRAMLEAMTDDERATAFLKIRQEWLSTLSAERRIAYDQRVQEAARFSSMTHDERRAHFEAKRNAWLNSLTPEQRNNEERRWQEMDKVRQLTPQERRAYFEKRRTGAPSQP